MSMYPVAERERQLAADRPSFLSRLAFSGVDDLAVPHEPPDIDEYVTLALRSGFPEVSYREPSNRSRTIWLTSYLDDLVTRGGGCFDGYATSQLRPEVALSHPRAALHHLRLEAGRREIDLVVEIGASRIVGIEFKAGSAPDQRDARHLFWLRDQLGVRFAAGAVLHSGPGIYQLGDRVYAVPLCAIWT